MRVDLMLFEFSSVTGISVDGQYVNNPFTKAFKKKFGFSSSSDYHLPVIWDACHLLNCAVTDVKNEKNGFKRSLFINVLSKDRISFLTISAEVKVMHY